MTEQLASLFEERSVKAVRRERRTRRVSRLGL